MPKTAVVILADATNPESLGRIVNGLMVAREAMEAGDEVTVTFDGAGTKGAANLGDPSHDYNELLESVRDTIAGACSYCANAFEAVDGLERIEIPLLDEYKGHPSVRRLITEGYEIVSF